VESAFNPIRETDDIMASLQANVVMEHLKSVVDPELGVNIVDLGLVYEILIGDEGAVTVKMTLTSPACPLGAVIQGQVHQALHKLPWVKTPHVELVWTPRWDPRTMASEDAKMELGIL
jgi:metal-sulfur cluster biosynthetic enzyme